MTIEDPRAEPSKIVAMRMSRERIRMLTWFLAILAPATFAVAAGIHYTPAQEEPQGVWECVPIPQDQTPSPGRVQA